MKKINILCIDDSRSIHAYLDECLKTISDNVVHVYNGQEAIDLLAKNNQSFDLIILDWEMPVKDGPQTFSEMQSMGITTPVFMLTSKNDPNDILKMLEAGVSEYMMKPFTADIVLEKIQQVLG
jgi:two-component system chemotaxis response regulator CheY